MANRVAGVDAADIFDVRPWPDEPGLSHFVTLSPEDAAKLLSTDTDAWARLYQVHFDGLYRHLGYLTSDPVAAEDLPWGLLWIFRITRLSNLALCR